MSYDNLMWNEKPGIKTKSWGQLSWTIHTIEDFMPFVHYINDDTPDSDVIALLNHTPDSDILSEGIMYLIKNTQFKGDRLGKIIRSIKRRSEIQIERDIAEKILDKMSIATPQETDGMTLYKDGVFIDGIIAETAIKQQIKEITRDIIISNEKGDKAYKLSMPKQHMVIDFIKSYTYCSLDDFDKAENRIINLKNGIFFIDGFEGDRKFLTHQEYIKRFGGPYKAFIQLPIDYDPTAECPGINKVFTDVFGSDTLRTVYKFCAYTILPTVKYSKAVMFYGPTGTGKTSGLNIIYQLVGHHHTSGIELQFLDVKFELEKTRNKLINIFDDLSSKPLRFVGNFKKLVTNTYLHGRIKHLQDEIRWLNRCKGLFACNILPTIEEYVTDAFYIRWILIPCFNNMRDLGILDESIREKIWSKSEMSGLFNKCVQGFQQLEDDNGFDKIWNDIDYVKNYWNMDREPVGKFIEECCKVGEGFNIDQNIFFRELNKFRKKHHVKELTNKGTVTKALKKQGIKKDDKGSKVQKEKRYYYKGIQFTEAYEKDHPELEFEDELYNNIELYANPEEPENIKEQSESGKIEANEKDFDLTKKNAELLLGYVTVELEFIGKESLEISNLYDLTAKKHNIPITSEAFKRWLEQKNDMFYTEIDDLKKTNVWSLETMET